MRKILALLISLIFVVTLTMTIGCPKKEEPKAPPAKETAPPAPAPAAPENRLKRRQRLLQHRRKIRQT